MFEIKTVHDHFFKSQRYLDVTMTPAEGSVTSASMGLFGTGIRMFIIFQKGY